jgi:hypothetical protein
MCLHIIYGVLLSSNITVEASHFRFGRSVRSLVHLVLVCFRGGRLHPDLQSRGLALEVSHRVASLARFATGLGTIATRTPNLGRKMLGHRKYRIHVLICILMLPNKTEALSKSSAVVGDFTYKVMTQVVHFCKDFSSYELCDQM